jgi:hypothetical protein
MASQTIRPVAAPDLPAAQDSRSAGYHGVVVDLAGGRFVPHRSARVQPLMEACPFGRDAALDLILIDRKAPQSYPRPPCLSGEA